MKWNAMLCLLAAAVAPMGCAVMGAQEHRFFAVNKAAGEAALARAAREAASPIAAPDEPVPFLSVVTPRKVLYKGEFTVIVADARRRIASLKAEAEKMGGYVQHMTQANMIVRVPAERFYEAVEKIEAAGTVTRRDISAIDVTEEYVDLELRLKNALALQERLREILKKAQNVKDALAVEVELNRVRAEAERIEGQLNRLKNRVAYATLAVSFVEIASAPRHLRRNLPFAWLKTLGLERVLSFPMGGAN